jgi:AcrR family transcriptional regulator
MTDKKAAILKAALKLFSSKGISATSTKKIAKAAGVSEALIFKYFINKKGLANALKLQGEDKFLEFFRSLETEKDPTVIIYKIIEVFFSADENDALYLKFSLRLDLEEKGGHNWKMELFYCHLLRAFNNLNSAEAEQETQFLMLFLKGIGSEVQNKSMYATPELFSFIIQKYELNSKF